MKNIDNVILTDLLALADEICQAERCTARQALKRAVREWTRWLDEDEDAPVAEPALLPPPGLQVVKAASLPPGGSDRYSRQGVSRVVAKQTGDQRRLTTIVEALAAEDAANQALADSVYAEIVHVAQQLQPDADTLDMHRAAQVWRGLRRAWHQAGEQEPFTQFAERVLATVGKEHV